MRPYMSTAIAMIHVQHTTTTNSNPPATIHGPRVEASVNVWFALLASCERSRQSHGELAESISALAGERQPSIFVVPAPPRIRRRLRPPGRRVFPLFLPAIRHEIEERPDAAERFDATPRGE